jgi:hypothetical protein
MFDMRTAITGLYIGLLFGLLSTLLSCDMKRLINNNMYFRHLIGLISFFLLFTITDKDNKNELNIKTIWINTIFVYGLFIMMTKSKWYFSIPALILIVVDQSYKFQIEFIHEKNKENEQNNEKIQLYEKDRKYIDVTILIIIFTGFIHYTLRQYTQFGSKFSFSKLLLDSTCKNE